MLSCLVENGFNSKFALAGGKKYSFEDVMFNTGLTKKIVKTFFKKKYNINLTDAQVSDIVNNAVGFKFSVESNKLYDNMSKDSYLETFYDDINENADSVVDYYTLNVYICFYDDEIDEELFDEELLSELSELIDELNLICSFYIDVFTADKLLNFETFYGIDVAEALDYCDNTYILNLIRQFCIDKDFQPTTGADFNTSDYILEGYDDFCSEISFGKTYEFNQYWCSLMYIDCLTYSDFCEDLSDKCKLYLIANVLNYLLPIFRVENKIPILVATKEKNLHLKDSISEKDLSFLGFSDWSNFGLVDGLGIELYKYFSK